MKLGIDALFVRNGFDGGKDQVLFNLLEGFEKLGYAKEIIIFCNQGMKEYYQEKLPNGKIIEVKKKRYKITSLLCRMKIITNKDIFDNFIFKGLFYRKIKKKYGIDVLFFPKKVTSILKCDAKTIVNPHDINPIINAKEYPKRNRREERWIYNIDFYLRDRIVSISEYDKSKIIENFPNLKEKVIRVYNPIRIKKDEKLILSNSNEKYILALNIMHTHKNILTLVKAFEKIKNKIQHKLYLVGKENFYTEQIKNYVKINKLSNRVIFTGYLSEEKVREILYNADLYVNPSLFEGFGMTAVEAMILGVPTLVANNTAMPEVTKGLCYYYNEAKNVDELANKILEILKNYPSQEKLENVSKNIFSEYNYLKIAEDYYQCFKSLIK